MTTGDVGQRACPQVVAVDRLAEHGGAVAARVACGRGLRGQCGGQRAQGHQGVAHQQTLQGQPLVAVQRQRCPKQSSQRASSANLIIDEDKLL